MIPTHLGASTEARDELMIRMLFLFLVRRHVIEDGRDLLEIVSGLDAVAAHGYGTRIRRTRPATKARPKPIPMAGRLSVMDLGTYLSQDFEGYSGCR